MIRTRLSCLLLAALLLLTGCATRLPDIPPPDTTAPNHQLWHWQLQGRLALNDGTQRQTVNLDWRQQGNHYQLMLFGPLGQGSLHLQGEPFRVALQTADGQLYQATSPEALLYQVSGWDLPLSNLVYWVRGLPAPGQQLQASGGLTQDGWLLEWRRYTQVDGYQLPSLLLASKGEMSLRLAISQWILNPPSAP